MLHGIDFPEGFEQRRGLRTLPVEKRRLLHGGSEAFDFVRTPTLGQRKRFVDDRRGGGIGHGCAGNFGQSAVVSEGKVTDGLPLHVPAIEPWVRGPEFRSSFSLSLG